MPTPQAPELNQIFAINEFGFFRPVGWEFLGKQETMLTQLADQSGILMRNVFKVGTQNAHLRLTRTHATVAVELSHLKLNTHFSPMTVATGTVLMVPTFRPIAGRASVVAEPIWNIPESMRLVFLINGGMNEKMDFSTSGFFLAAQHRETARLYLLPLPNLHDHGEICMGRGLNVLSESSLQDKAVLTTNAFADNSWNADLLNENRLERCHILFRFDTDLRSIPYVGDWTTLCRPFTNTSGDFLPTIFPALAMPPR